MLVCIVEHCSGDIEKVVEIPDALWQDVKHLSDKGAILHRSEEGQNMLDILDARDDVLPELKYVKVCRCF